MARKSQRLHALSWKGILLSVIVIVTFGFIGAKSTLDYILGKELQSAINKEIIVEAEIVALVHTARGKNGGGHYDIMYRYTDESGIVYEGYCGRGYTYESEIEDRKRIGEKVEIYVGGMGSFHQPLCRAVSFGKKVDVSTNVILMCVFYPAILLYAVAVIIYCLAFYDKLPILRRNGK